MARFLRAGRCHRSHAATEGVASVDSTPETSAQSVQPNSSPLTTSGDITNLVAAQHALATGPLADRAMTACAVKRAGGRAHPPIRSVQDLEEQRVAERERSAR